MARLYTTGFESRDLATIEGLPVGGSMAVDTSIFRTGSASLSGGRGDWQFTGATARDYYGRSYIYVRSFPGSAAIVSAIWDGGSNGAQVMLNTDGTLFLQSSSTGSQIGSASSALSLTTWYRVELHIKVNTSSGDDTAELRLNGVTIVSSTTADLGTAAPGAFSMGSSTINTDDAAFNDGTGASQTSWPGEGSVVLLLPTADSAKGTGWTNDAAGASNFFNAVDNEPPVGIADTTSGSGLHQIRNATSNASSNYDATMTTYAAAGIGAFDTINLIDPIIATAAPVTTSSKQGTVGVASNPTIANIALGAGGTSGAFWSGVAAGTYPTGWKISHGTLTIAPSVTVGTAPVMRVTQVTSSTRIAMVCFMGMYVDYTPGLLPYTSPYPPALAQ